MSSPRFPASFPPQSGNVPGGHGLGSHAANDGASQAPLPSSFSGTRKKGWFWGVLPPSAPLLWLMLMLLGPMALLGGESLLYPLVEKLPAFLTSGEISMPFLYFLKVLAFGAMVFLAFSQLILRLQVCYFTEWSLGFPRPHHLHVDYAPHPRESMAALIRWQGFRAMRVVVPPLLFTVLTALIGTVALFLFNHWMASLSLLNPIFMIISIFLLSVAGVATMLFVINSIWVSLTSLYGVCAAVSEPDLPTFLLYERVNRIAFCSPWTWLLIPLYGLCHLGLLAFIVWLLWVYSIEELMSLQLNFGLILALELLLVVAYTSVNYLRWVSYNKALVVYYNKLPAFIKQQFTPPPSGRMAHAS